MHARILRTDTLASDGAHNAFTDLCTWRGATYCAYRTAATHNIIPPGYLAIHRRKAGELRSWTWTSYLKHPTGDVRDPRFCATRDALWLLCGIYLPNPQWTHSSGLSASPGDNLIVTHASYTTNGEDWSPLIPILRPMYWGWSLIHGPRCFLSAAYHTGTVRQTSSVHLWGGKSVPGLLPLGCIYDGASLEVDAYTPCEPTLCMLLPDMVACLIRTEQGCQLGIAHTRNLQQWRWRACEVTDGATLHPSAILHTAQGWVVAARTLRTMETPRGETYEAAGMGLYHLNPGLARLEPIACVPALRGAGDCGYAGLTPGADEGTILCSYYTQQPYLYTGAYGSTLPAADVLVSTLHLG